MDKLIRLQERDGQKNLLHRRLYNYYVLRGGGLKPFCVVRNENGKMELPKNFPVTVQEYMGIAGSGEFGIVERFNTKEHGEIVIKSQRATLTPVLKEMFMPNGCAIELDETWLQDCTTMCTDADTINECCAYYNMFQEMYTAQFAGEIEVGPTVHALVIDIDEENKTIHTHIYMQSLRMTLDEYMSRDYSLMRLQRIEDRLRAHILTLTDELNVIPLDIRPENVMLDAEHNPYLIDFGGGWMTPMENDEMSTVPFVLFAMHGIIRQQYFYFANSLFNVNVESLQNDAKVMNIIDHYFPTLNLNNLAFLIDAFTLLRHTHREIHLKRDDDTFVMSPSDVVTVLLHPSTFNVDDENEDPFYHRWTMTSENGRPETFAFPEEFPLQSFSMKERAVAETSPHATPLEDTYSQIQDKLRRVKRKLKASKFKRFTRDDVGKEWEKDYLSGVLGIGMSNIGDDMREYNALMDEKKMLTTTLKELVKKIEKEEATLSTNNDASNQSEPVDEQEELAKFYFVEDCELDQMAYTKLNSDRVEYCDKLWNALSDDDKREYRKKAAHAIRMETFRKPMEARIQNAVTRLDNAGDNIRKTVQYSGSHTKNRTPRRRYRQQRNASAQDDDNTWCTIA